MVNARAKNVSNGMVLKSFWWPCAVGFQMGVRDGFEMRWKNHMVAEELHACAIWWHMKSSLAWMWSHKVGIITYMCVRNVWSMG